MKKLILIDGNAIVHRAFHGLPPLTAPDGELVNAVYGFFSMFLKILQDHKPDYIIVCFDRPAPTFRKQLYVGYQAKRPAMAEGLGPQFNFIRTTLRHAKVSIYELDGYEADDLIGTLATQAVEKDDDRKLKVEDSSLNIENGSSIDLRSSNLKNPSSTINHPSSNVEVIIFSGDRDLLQLVNSQVSMLAPVTGITNMLLFDEAKVIDKYGLKPSQFVDYKALVGDNSDNYPGVNGIGPKTAATLLSKYESFENLYHHIGELPEKIGLKLATDAEQAALAKKLATIVTDAPIHLDMDAAEVGNIDRESLKASFGLFGFSSLVNRLGGGMQDAKGTNETEERKETQETKVKKLEKKKDDQQLGLL